MGYLFFISFICMLCSSIYFLTCVIIEIIYLIKGHERNLKNKLIGSFGYAVMFLCLCIFFVPDSSSENNLANTENSSLTENINIDNNDYEIEDDYFDDNEINYESNFNEKSNSENTEINIIFILFALTIYLIALGKYFEHKRFKKPLTDEEIELLVKIRKNRHLINWLNFSKNDFRINENYRKSLRCDGRWDKVEINYNETLSALTALLRYKRHEWAIYALCNSNYCIAIWANKGDDNKSTYLKNYSFREIIEITKSLDCTTIIHFHNHPHTQDIYWDILSPSETDCNTAKYQISECKMNNINYVSALCAQGDFIIYDKYFSDANYPVKSTKEYILSQNNISEEQNIKLHKEIKWNKKYIS